MLDAPTMSTPNFHAEEDLQLAVDHLAQFFDLEAIAAEEYGNKEVQKYFTDSNLGYNIVHSGEGSVHMAINYDEKYNIEGYYQQVKEIQEYIAPGQSILELGCGKGFNSAYLAERNNDVTFTGIDLTKKHLQYAQKRARSKSNLSFVRADYHTTPFEDQQFNNIFVLEAACYSKTPEVLFQEMLRVLKPGGRFILYEGFRKVQFNELSDIQKFAATLVEKTMAVNLGYDVDQWLNMAKKAGFEVEEAADLSKYILPNLKRFHRLALRFLSKPTLARIAGWIMPKYLIRNAIAALLLPFTVAQGVQNYTRVVLKKPEIS